MTRTGIDPAEPERDEPEELPAWIAAGFVADEAEVWRRWRFTIAEAQAWKYVGVGEGLHAAQWSTAGIRPDTVQAWRDVGVESPEAVRWHEFGYGLDVARAAKQQGRGPEDEWDHRRSLSQGTSRMMSSTLGDRMSSALGRLHAAGVEPEVMQSYMNRQWVDDEAIAWAVMGIDAHDAYLWHDLGLSPVEAVQLVMQGRSPGQVVTEWWRAGIPFDEVADWIGAGLSVGEAVEQRSHGITSEQAAALRALRQQDLSEAESRQRRARLPRRIGPPGSDRAGPPPEERAAAQDRIVDSFAAMLIRDETSNTIPTVEGGSNLAGCLAEAARHLGSISGRIASTVTVSLVRFINEHEASVTFAVVPTDGLGVALPDLHGTAVLIDGVWKVARETFCEVMEIVGVQCPPPEK